MIAEQRHPVSLARFACFLITVQRPWKVIQADQAHGHVTQDDGNTLRIFIGQQSLISPLVLRNSFLETILAVKDVAEIDVETCETPSVVETCEYLPGASRSFEGLIVLTKQNQRLDGTAQSSRSFLFDFKLFVKSDGLFVVLDGRGVVSAGVKGVRLCSQPESQALFPSQFPSDQDGRFRQAHSLACVDANPLNDESSQVLDNFAANQAPMASEKLSARRPIHDLSEAGIELVQGDFFNHRGHQSKPNSLRCLRRRSMHFWRVKPMEPTARPSSSATSA